LNPKKIFNEDLSSSRHQSRLTQMRLTKVKTVADLVKEKDDFNNQIIADTANHCILESKSNEELENLEKISAENKRSKRNY
jgi:acetyl-CoA carboxylase alpha subunit